MATITGVIRGNASQFIRETQRATAALAAFERAALAIRAPINRSAESSSRSMAGLQRQLDATARSMRSLNTQIRGLNRQNVQVRQTTRQASSGMSKMSTGVGGLASSFGGLITTIIAFKAISAIFSGLSGIASLALDLERANAEVSTLTSLSVNATRVVTDGAREISRAFGIDALDAVNAVYQAISAGQEPAKVVAFIGESAKLASAGLGDLKGTVDLTTSILNAYQFSAKNAAEETQNLRFVTNVLFKTVEQGKVTLDDLQRSLGRAIPAFANAGLSVVDLGAAVAVLTKGAKKPRESVTGLVQAIKSLQKPTKAAQILSKQIGFAFNQSALDGQTFVSFIGKLRAKLAELSKEGIDAKFVINTLFGSKRASNVIIPLVGKQFEQLQESALRVGDLQDSVADANAKFNETLARNLKVLKAGASDAFGSIGQDIAAISLEFLKSATGAKTTEEALKGLFVQIKAVGRGFRSALTDQKAFAGKTKEEIDTFEKAKSIAESVKELVGLVSGISKINNSVSKLIFSFVKVSDAVVSIKNAIQEIVDVLSGKAFSIAEFLGLSDLNKVGFGAAIDSLRKLVGLKGKFSARQIRARTTGSEELSGKQSAIADNIRTAREISTTIGRAAGKKEQERLFQVALKELGQARSKTKELDAIIDSQDKADKAKVQATLDAAAAARVANDNAAKAAAKETKLRETAASSFVLANERLDAVINGLKDAAFRTPEIANEIQKTIIKLQNDREKIFQARDAGDFGVKANSAVNLALRGFDVAKFTNDLAVKFEQKQIDVNQAAFDKSLKTQAKSFERESRRRTAFEASANKVRAANRLAALKEESRAILNQVRDDGRNTRTELTANEAFRLEQIRRERLEIQRAVRESSIDPNSISRLFSNSISQINTETLSASFGVVVQDALRAPLKTITVDLGKEELLAQSRRLRQGASRELTDIALRRQADLKAKREDESIQRLQEFNDSLKSASELVSSTTIGLDTKEGQARAKQAFIQSELQNRAASRRLGVPLSGNDLVNPAILFDKLLAQGGIKILRAQTGGVVPGVGRGDKIPALLEPGERVVKRDEAPFVGAILQALRQGGSVQSGTTLNIQSLTLAVDVRGQGGADIADGAIRRLVRLSDLGQVDTAARFS